jgi:DNA-directed RNA polymerase subunit RPC12/RpoP
LYRLPNFGVLQAVWPTTTGIAPLAEGGSKWYYYVQPVIGRRAHCAPGSQERRAFARGSSGTLDFMQVRADNWQCNDCSKSFAYAGDPVRAQCPSCGSLLLVRIIDVKDEIGLAVSEHMRLVCKDPSLRSKGKRRRELRSGVRTEGNGSGRLVIEYRVIEADNDRYEEKITDIQSGEIIREIAESLSEHRNCGSAKKK